MHFKQIIVVKETRENEKRVSLTPRVVAHLVQRGYKVLVEKDAGVNSGFANEDYTKVGAKLFTLDESGIPAESFIVRVLRPSKERELLENELFRKNTAMLGFLFPFVGDDHIAKWQHVGLTTLSFDLFKSLPIDDPKNAQAAMSRIAGRLAFHDALKHYQGSNPVKVTVIGPGAAGMSAALEAAKAKVPVKVFGRSERHRAELEKAGIKYYVIPNEETQIEFIRPFLKDQTIVITAARTPGVKAPLLINEASLDLLPAKSVVVDLAISTGSNVVGSKHDHVGSYKNNIIIMNVSGYPKSEPKLASEVYAQCVYSLLTEIMSEEGEVLFENNLVQELWVTHKGNRHDSLYDSFMNTLEQRPRL